MDGALVALKQPTRLTCVRISFVALRGLLEGRVTQHGWVATPAENGPSVSVSVSVFGRMDTTRRVWGGTGASTEKYVKIGPKIMSKLPHLGLALVLDAGVILDLVGR